MKKQRTKENAMSKFVETTEDEQYWDFEADFEQVKSFVEENRDSIELCKKIFAEEQNLPQNLGVRALQKKLNSKEKQQIMKGFDCKDVQEMYKMEFLLSCAIDEQKFALEDLMKEANFDDTNGTCEQILRIFDELNGLEMFRSLFCERYAEWFPEVKRGVNHNPPNFASSFAKRMSGEPDEEMEDFSPIDYDDLDDNDEKEM